MPEIILDYGVLEAISVDSKALGKCAEEYGEKLDREMVTAIDNITGVSTGHLERASDSIKDKIQELKVRSHPDLKKVATYKNPKNNNADTILKTYNKIVKEASKKDYNIKKYTDIVDIDRKHVASNYAWETAGYYWSVNKLTSADSSTPVDDVTKVVNKWTDSYKDRVKAYEKVKKYIN